MKRQLLIATLIASLAMTGQAYAATTTPTTDPALNNQINTLKNKIASQVAQLNLVEKRGVIGTIQQVSANQMALIDTNGNTQYVDLDEITKFSSAASSSFGLSDLKKGMLVSVLGIYNKESQRILARFVDTETVPTRYYGEIAAIDGKNFAITVATDDQKMAKVEIDTTSTVYSYTNGSDLTRYGFSKLTVGDRVAVIGYPDKKDATMLIADRMIDYLNAPKNPNITMVTPTVVPTASPTSTGAKSLNPIK